VPAANKDELEGITLSVYLYIVKKGRPVGPRDATKGARLSSPSVAYRHLEKLEERGLLKKNESGEYVVKRKANIEGLVWLGRRAVPKMLVYSTIFLSILIIEFIVLGLHYAVETFEFKIFFVLLTLVTGFAMTVFVVEGLLQRRRLKRYIQSE
jgi:hypothetical protein